MKFKEWLVRRAGPELLTGVVGDQKEAFGSSFDRAQSRWDSMSPGDDDVECPQCRGETRVLCDACEGEGCDECNRGKVKCRECDGRGVVPRSHAQYYHRDD